MPSHQQHRHDNLQSNKQDYEDEQLDDEEVQLPTSNKGPSSSATKCGNVKCQTTDTPLWRKGWKKPDGKGYVMLCNSCGLHYKKKHYCYHCNQIYREKDCDDTSMPWISCERCHRWVHVACEEAITAKNDQQNGMNTDKEQESQQPTKKKVYNSNEPFYCSTCLHLKAQLNNDEDLFARTFAEVKKRRKRPLNHLLGNPIIAATVQKNAGASKKSPSSAEEKSTTRRSTANKKYSIKIGNTGKESADKNFFRNKKQQQFHRTSQSSPLTPGTPPSFRSLFNAVDMASASSSNNTNLDYKQQTQATTDQGTMQPPPAPPMLDLNSSRQQGTAFKPYNYYGNPIRAPPPSPVSANAFSPQYASVPFQGSPLLHHGQRVETPPMSPSSESTLPSLASLFNALSVVNNNGSPAFNNEQQQPMEQQQQAYEEPYNVTLSNQSIQQWKNTSTNTGATAQLRSRPAIRRGVLVKPCQQNQQYDVQQSPQLTSMQYSPTNSSPISPTQPLQQTYQRPATLPSLNRSLLKEALMNKTSTPFFQIQQDQYQQQQQYDKQQMDPSMVSIQDQLMKLPPILDGYQEERVQENCPSYSQISPTSTRTYATSSTSGIPTTMTTSTMLSTPPASSSITNCSKFNVENMQYGNSAEQQAKESESDRVKLQVSRERIRQIFEQTAAEASNSKTRASSASPTCSPKFGSLWAVCAAERENLSQKK